MDGNFDFNWLESMRFLVRVFALLIVLPLSGCMTCMSSWCLGDETYQRLLHPKPYGTHWIKDGMTEEQRRADSWACGAAPTVLAADHVVFTKEQERIERRPEEKDDFGANERLTKTWIACMRSKGYAYVK